MARSIAVSLLVGLLICSCASVPPPELAISDEELIARVERALRGDFDLMPYNIGVGAVNGVMTLHGRVLMEQHRLRASIVAQGVKGVRGVINDIVISR